MSSYIFCLSVYSADKLYYVSMSTAMQSRYISQVIGIGSWNSSRAINSPSSLWSLCTVGAYSRPWVPWDLFSNSANYIIGCSKYCTLVGYFMLCGLLLFLHSYLTPVWTISLSNWLFKNNITIPWLSTHKILLNVVAPIMLIRNEPIWWTHNAVL